ncbi:MAG TPA: hypothetical protein VI818_06340 [Candidatus Thermoplasmatota archaeon]|nr:hypothetical protein [Candidatus Thermoplasmatota archaeon]
MLDPPGSPEARLITLLTLRLRKHGYTVYDERTRTWWDLVAWLKRIPLYIDIVRPAEPTLKSLEDAESCYEHVLEHAKLPSDRRDGDVNLGRAGVGLAATKALLWAVDHPNAGVALAWPDQTDVSRYMRPIIPYLASYGVEAVVFPPTPYRRGSAAGGFP